jgi:two-component system response regulator FixJ
MRARPIVYVVDGADDDRKSLKWLFAAADLHVREFVSAEEVLATDDREPPGCIVLEIALPGMDGLELLNRLRARGIRPPAIILTGHGDIPLAVRALKAGAFDFIEKPTTGDALLHRVREALASDQRRRQREQRRLKAQKRLAQLTPREREVLERLVQGSPSRSIARDLGIGDRTLETHRQNLMNKMDVNSIAELVRLAATIRETP